MYVYTSFLRNRYDRSKDWINIYDSDGLTIRSNVKMVIMLASCL